MNDGEGEARIPVEEAVRRYVEAREAGVRVSLEGMARETGCSLEELRRKVELYELLSGLGGARIAEERAPETLGRFQILEALARGGAGIVYRARDTRLGREVALKLLSVSQTLSRDERDQLLHEARAMARLDHPNVCKVLEVDQAEGRDYVAMELLEGPTLAGLIRHLRRIRDGEPLDLDPKTRELVERYTSLRARVGCLIDLARALHHAHDQGILHRDVKPGNILFDTSGTPKLIDFGNAHRAEADAQSRSLDLTGRLVGTAGYLAPEQVDQERIGIDPRSDQFALGVVAYEFFSLRFPFEGETRQERLNAVSRVEFSPLRTSAPAIPVPLERIVHHALERRPADRYPSLAAFAADLENVLEDRPISVEAPSWTRLLRLALRRHRRRVILAAAAATGLAVGAFVPWLLGIREQVAAIRAEVSSALPSLDASTEEWLASGHQLLALRNRARVTSSSWLRRRLAGSAVPDVQKACDAWSRRLQELYRRTEQRLAEEGGELQERAWMRLVDLESQVSPDAPYNRDLRTRGCVRFPSELEGLETRLFHQEPVAPRGFFQEFLAFRRVPDFDPLGPGVFPLNPGRYRLLVWTPGAERLSFQREFLVPGGWHPLIEVELHEPRSDILTAARRVGPVQIHKRSPPADAAPLLEYECRLPAFRITPLVSWEWIGTTRSGLDPASPAGLSALEAEAFAARVGGRLPSILELVEAHRAGAIEFDLDGRIGEWTNEAPFAQTASVALFSYPLFEEKGPDAWYTDYRSITKYDQRIRGLEADSFAGFRVLFQVDRPESCAAFDVRAR